MVTLIVLIIVAVGIVIYIYNGLIAKKNQVANAFGAIDAMLKKRYDLIPNLISAVSQYMQYEKGVLTEITALRAKAIAPNVSEADKMDINNKLTKAIGGLMVAVENYPQLKSNEQFNRLMDELAGTENRIAVERMRYNERIQAYDTARRQFPGLLTAKLFSFKDYPLFAAPPEARQGPKVDFTKP